MSSAEHFHPRMLHDVGLGQWNKYGFNWMDLAYPKEKSTIDCGITIFECFSSVA